MNERSERIVAGLSGIAFVVLSAVVAALPPFPAVGASAQAVVAYYGAHQRAFLVLNFLGVAGLVPGLVVLAYLTAVFRRAEREGGWLWILTLAGGLFAFIAAWVDLALFQCAAYAAVRGDERIARALSDVATLTFGIFFLAQFAFSAAFAWAARALRTWPGWVGATSALVAFLSLVASWGAVDTAGALAAGGPVTLVAFLAILLWFLAFSILILARARRSARLVTQAQRNARMSTSPGRVRLAEERADLRSDARGLVLLDEVLRRLQNHGAVACERSLEPL